MAEVRPIAPIESFKFVGLMDVKEVGSILYNWLSDHGYEKNDLWNYEEVTDIGKQMTLRLRPFREISDYARAEIEINILFGKLKEVTIEKKGMKRKLMKGEVEVKIEPFIVTDYEEKWETNPVYFFLKMLGERLLYKSYIDRYEEATIQDKNRLMRELKSYLNMQRF